MPRGILTKEQRERQLQAMRTPEYRAKISARSKGHIVTAEQRKRIGDANRGKNHGLWKGDKVGYEGLHEWVRNNYPPPDKCEDCDKIGEVDACNISGKYLRVRNDWKYRCRKCHMLSDGRLENFELRKFKNGKYVNELL